MKTKTNTRIAIFNVLAVCTAILAISGAAYGQSSGFQFAADAYGTQATLGNTVVAGRTAIATLGSCGVVEPPLHNENTVVSTDAAPLLTTGVVNTTADAATLVDG